MSFHPSTVTIPQEGTPLPNPITQPSIPPEIFIKITIHHVRRLATLLGLGFWGGWSCFPDEKRVPTSITWVIFIVILTDWSICTSLLSFSQLLM